MYRYLQNKLKLYRYTYYFNSLNIISETNSNKLFLNYSFVSIYNHKYNNIFISNLLHFVYHMTLRFNQKSEIKRHVLNLDYVGI